MQFTLSSICDCCGLLIAPGSGEDCPHCKYPISLVKEKHFLESSLHDLQRVADHGGANVTVNGLIARYRTRLNYLRSLQAGVFPQRFEAVQPALPMETKEPGKVLIPPALSQAQVSSEEVGKTPVMPAVSAPVVAKEQEPKRPAHRSFSFSWRSFVVDQAITIIGLLGAFLILMGALSSVVTTSGNPLLSFLIVFGVHTFFGIAGVVAYRFANFKLIARIYSGIYVLLVPLVGFTGFNLLLGIKIPISVPTLIVIAATYAAVVYTLLALYQRFSVYGYLGVMALIVADLAVAIGLHLNYCWWPSMLMLLAFTALTSIVRSPVTRRERYFTGILVVLRQPVRVFMYTIVCICLLSAVAVTLISLNLGNTGTFLKTSMEEIRFSILSTLDLLLIWIATWFWQTKRTREMPVLALLFLACALAFSYAFDFSQSGYALVLVSVALFYHGLNRFVPHLLQPFGKLGVYLDQIALLLVCLVPFISSFLLPQQLFFAAYQIPLNNNSNLYVHANWAAVAELIAVGLGCIITVSMCLLRANHRAANRRNNWPWLLLLSGFLLNWEFSIIVLTLKFVPVWCFVGLTLAFIVIAVLVRQRFGSYLANPIDVLVLGETALALSLSLNLNAGHLSALLLGFAALFFVVVLYQRRQHWLFLPLVLAALALPILLFSYLYVTLLIGALLPFVAVAIRHIMANRTLVVSAGIATKSGRATIWEWPLLAVGLLYGAVAGLIDVLFYSGLSQSAVGNWPGVSFPVALELAVLSLAWYISAALARVRWWLLPVIGFAGGAMLLPSNPFWVLATVTLAASILGFAVSRSFDRTWASPLYVVALLSAVMTGIVGYQNPGQLLATSWILLSSGLLFYVIGLLEGLEPCLWLLPAFTIWALVDAAQLGDLYRPPIIALLYAGVGVGIGLLNVVLLPFLGTAKKNNFLKYALPFYATAFAVALLTGMDGTFTNVSPFFYLVVMMLYALIAYAVALFERRPSWLLIVASFAVWATLLTIHTTAYYVAGIAIAAGIVGMLTGRLIRRPAVDGTAPLLVQWQHQFSWNWPWYITALVAAVVTGLWPHLPVTAQPVDGFIEYFLFAFAVLFYIVALVEDRMEMLWVGSLFATWSLINSARVNDFPRLLITTLVYTIMGMLISYLPFLRAISDTNQRKKLSRYALPFYTTALISAVLGGCDITLYTLHNFLYGSIPDALPLLVYASVAFGVLFLERQPRWLALVAGFGIWGVLLAPRASIEWVIGIAIATALIGLLLGEMMKLPVLHTDGLLSRYMLSTFVWKWPWYLISLFAMIWTVVWQQIFGVESQADLVAYSLLVFSAITVCIMLVERVPEMLVFPVIFAALAILLWHPHLDITATMIAFTMLCVLIFVSQLVWKVITPLTRSIPASLLHNALGIGGQFLILLVIMINGGLFASSGPLAFVGAGSLVVLVLMAFCYGRIQENNVVRRYCDYSAGLLLSLVVSWTLAAFGQTNLDLLTLAPATYLTVIAPLLLRDETLPEHRILGEVIAVLGAVLLLLPTLWLSFAGSEGNLLYMLVLMGEALALLLLGIGAGVRIFVLTGAGLIVVAALHALFLPALGIPTPLALTILGVTLLGVATGLSLIRRRLRTAWSQWD